jgi:hypothetical protein
MEDLQHNEADALLLFPVCWLAAYGTGLCDTGRKEKVMAIQLETTFILTLPETSIRDAWQEMVDNADSEAAVLQLPAFKDLLADDGLYADYIADGNDPSSVDDYIQYVIDNHV